MRTNHIVCFAAIIAALSGYVPCRAEADLTLPRERVTLVAPPFVHAQEHATKSGPKIIEFEMTAMEKPIVIDEAGTTIPGLTYNGSIPGPLMVVHEGDYVELTIVNPATNTMMHTIDFQAATGALGGAALMQVNPGERAVLRWKATRAGVFVYRYAPGGSMTPLHVISGMSGAVMVLPCEGLRDKTSKPLHYDRIYYVGENDFYVPRSDDGKFQSFTDASDYFPKTLELMRKLVPTHVVFEGKAGALTGKTALLAKVDETVLIVHSQADTIALVLGTGELRANGSHSHETGSSETAIAGMGQKITLSVPDIDVVDQNGRKLKFQSDLVKGHTVAINFIYTDCASICPMLTANFASVQDQLGERFGQDIFFVSVSLDPQHDTPQKLAKFASEFGARPGWSFVTGAPGEVSALLTALNANVSAKEDHSALALIGNGQVTGRIAGNTAMMQWTRVYGLSAPQEITKLLISVAAAQETRRNQTPTDETRRANYFTNLRLLDQNGHAWQFFDDMVRDQLVVIVPFYTSCGDICPTVVGNLQHVQSALPPEIRKNVRMIGISVDADKDRPEALQDFATSHGLDDHWSLLTGKKENVDWILYKLGLNTERAEDHSTLILIGNDQSGEWVKLMGTEAPPVIARSIQTLSVTN